MPVNALRHVSYSRTGPKTMQYQTTTPVSLFQLSPQFCFVFLFFKLNFKLFNFKIFLCMHLYFLSHIHVTSSSDQMVSQWSISFYWKRLNVTLLVLHSFPLLAWRSCTSENHCLSVWTNHCHFVSEALPKCHFLRLALSALNLNAPLDFTAGEQRGPLMHCVHPCRIKGATLRGSCSASVFISFLCAKSPYQTLGLQDRLINIHKNRVSTFVPCVDSLTTRRSTACMY